MILDITSWWQGLDFFAKTYWAIALLFSALFLIQLLLSFTGGDTDATGDADGSIHEDAGMGAQYFTLKNMVAFFTLFGWMGVIGTQAGWNPLVILVASVLAGLAMVLLLVWLVSRMLQLQQSGTMQISNAIHQVGNTYLFIPAARSGTGKVQLKVQGSVHELDAVTDDAQDIPTGKLVQVTGVIGHDLLVVTAQVS